MTTPLRIPRMSATPPSQLSFEQAMDRLDEIVARMEVEKLPLEEMVASYEEGMQLLQSCRQRIEAARRRVELINAGNGEGASLTAFDPETAVAEEAPKTPARRKSAKPETGDSADIRLF